MKHIVLVPLYKIGLCNELGLLLQVIHNTKGTITCFFINLVDIPKGRKTAGGKFVWDFKPQKTEK